MKVSALIEKLNNLPKDSEVMVMNEMGGFSPVEYVESLETASHEIHSQAHYEPVIEMHTEAEIISTVALLSFPYSEE